jgi:serine kinase of HPr protein (carbohydrate metabolism regulator)
MIMVHGTTVALEGEGVLLRGPSGSGKSDLALRLIDGGARLVADDQTELTRTANGLIARSPAWLRPRPSL